MTTQETDLLDQAEILKDLNVQAAAAGIVAAPRPALPFVDGAEYIFEFIQALRAVNFKGGEWQLWEDTKARVYAKYKAINDKLAAERKRKIEETWLNWERLDDARIAAFQQLEDSPVTAYNAAHAAFQSYPGNHSDLPKRYGAIPETVEGCAALAAKQSETIRLLRDKAGAP